MSLQINTGLWVFIQINQQYVYIFVIYMQAMSLEQKSGIQDLSAAKMASKAMGMTNSSPVMHSSTSSGNKPLQNMLS